MHATGVGSLPGTDLPGALRFVLGGFEHAWLPELPARGAGAAMVGRTAGMLEGLGADLQPQGWRLVERSGIDQERARSLLRRDLDELEEAAQAFTGSLTLTAAGPWTMAASLERPRGDKVLGDHGARRELAESLALGLAQLLAELHRRLPAVALRLQLDEPMLPMVLAGRVPTASGWATLRSVDRPVASQLLQVVTEAARPHVDQLALHCCAPGMDVDLCARSGIDALVLDADTIPSRQWDELGGWLEAGRELRLGLAPTATADRVSTADELVFRGLQLLRPLGLDPVLLQQNVALTTGCGLAGWGTAPAARQMENLAQAADLLAEQLAR